MGFFDDLDRELAPVPDEVTDTTGESVALALAIDRIAAGTSWSGQLCATQRRSRDDTSLEQWVRIEFRNGRFEYTSGVARGRTGRAPAFESSSTRRLDRSGLVELLRDQPLLARRLVESNGAVYERED